MTPRRRKTRPELHFGLAVCIFGAIWLTHLVSAYLYGSSVFARHDRNVRLLTEVLPELERTRIRVWRMEGDCVGIENDSGAHGTPLNVPPCPLPTTNEEFLGSAQDDLGALARALDATGVSVRAVDVRYVNNGHVELARFRVDCASCGVRDYVYTLNDALIPSITPHTKKILSISAHWHLIEGI